MRDKDADASDFERPAAVDPAALLTVVRVPREWERWRLDRVVHATFSRMSRTRAQAVVAIGAYAPDGRKLRSNDRVRFDDVVLLYRPPFEEPQVRLDCPILYEDDVLLAIDKPPGLPVHPTAKWHHNTVVSVLAKARPGEFLGLCHRIDRETSGVLLLAKTLAAERFVKRALEVHVLGTLANTIGAANDGRFGVAKRYLSVTWGAPKPAAGRIAQPLILDADSRYRVKMRTATEGESGALAAATLYETLEIRAHPEDPSRRYASVVCDLESGRQHQIRAHLAAVGLPVVGDKLYADERIFLRFIDDELTAEDLRQLRLPRQALHAATLAVRHPFSGEAASWTAPLPLDLVTFLASLRPVH